MIFWEAKSLHVVDSEAAGFAPLQERQQHVFIEEAQPRVLPHCVHVARRVKRQVLPPEAE